MAELGLRDVSLSFGGAPLLDGVSLQVEKGERIGLLGRNGSGKSTLLGVLSGRIEPDDGAVDRRPGLRVAALAQEVPEDLGGTVAICLRAGLEASDVDGDWEVEERVERIARTLGLDLDADAGSLSAGAKRRVLLGRALISRPDVLILDEPTNHLDVEAIEGLEELLGARKTSLVFVTHDRAFLKALATRILHLDRGQLTSYSCDYDTYLMRREEELAAEEKQAAELDKKLAKEEAWLRRGIKARRTRDMGRVRALKELRKERAARRESVGRVGGELQEAGRTGQLVLRAKGLTHAYEGEPLFEGLDLEIQRGDRIGVLGPNGCGKTTLLKILLEELEPDSGTVRHGTKLEIARFDQLHAQLDPSKTLRENVCDEGDMITIGSRTRHVVGYLRDFLFDKDQIQGSIRYLSGGERNRLQLAKILARPCNLLVLDEPTNDLDLETLERLEELLFEFEGTLIVVSHDRAFLENVVTSTIVFEGDGVVREHFGGFTDWRRTRDAEEAEAAAKAKPVKSAKPAAAGEGAPKARKLTYGEQLELKDLPERIESLEEEKRTLEATMSNPDFYSGDPSRVGEATSRLQELTTELDQVVERWAELEELAG